MNQEVTRKPIRDEFLDIDSGTDILTLIQSRCSNQCHSILHVTMQFTMIYHIMVRSTCNPKIESIGLVVLNILQRIIIFLNMQIPSIH